MADITAARPQATTDTVVLSIQHIVKTPGVCAGVARVAGRRIPVHQIAYEVLQLGRSIADLVDSYDLTPAQIHAALAHFYDHSDEIKQDMENERQAQERMVARFGKPEEDDALRARWRVKHPEYAADPEPEMTIAEIATTYHINPRGAREAAAKGWIPARKSGATWLIKRGDAYRRWGKQDK